MTFKDNGSMELVEEDTSDVPVQVNQLLFYIDFTLGNCNLP